VEVDQGPEAKSGSARPGSTPRRRPLVVTWMCLGVLTLAGVQIAGFLGSLQLPDLPFAAPRAYLLARSGLWALCGLMAAIGLFSGASWAPALLRWGGVGLAAWYWADRILLGESEFSRSGVPFCAATTMLLLGAGLWGLSRPEARRYFEENRG